MLYVFIWNVKFVAQKESQMSNKITKNKKNLDTSYIVVETLVVK